jgi:CRP/FNR family transcriptional regulator
MKNPSTHNEPLAVCPQPFPGANPCNVCALCALCLPHENTHGNGPALNPVEKRQRTLKKGDALFRAGDPFRSLFVILSGSIKTSIVSHKGDTQVLSFALPGELLGSDAIDNLQHPCSATALETTTVCEFAYAQLEKLSRAHPNVQHRMLLLMSDEIIRGERLMAMLGHHKAETRLASFLLHFTDRYPRKAATNTAIRLPMSRQEIGDYLGLSLETVSRLLSRFHLEGLARVQGRQIQIVDVPRLRDIAEPCYYDAVRIA